MRAVAAGLVCLLGIAVTTVAGAAGLDENVNTQTTATPTPTGYTVGVSAWSEGGGVRVGTNPLAGCVILAGLTPNAAIDYAGGRGINLGITNPGMEASEKSWVFISCPDRVLGAFDWAVWEQGETPPAAVINALADAALAAVVIPELAPQSAPDGIDTPFLTQLPVWLWVPEASWAPVSGTASLAGLGLSITVTATPVSTDWTTNADVNETVTCGAGTPWRAGLDDDATDCSATYTSTTPPGTTVDLTVTTNFDAALTCSPGLCGPAGPFVPGFAVTVSRPITVTQARGVITR